MAKHKKRLRLRSRTVVIVAVTVLLLTVGGVVAKYVWNKVGESLISAKEFYFTSNLLTEEGQKYVLNSDTTEISFVLGNNADKLRYAEDSIEYTVTVTCEGESPVLTPQNGTLAGGTVSSATVILSNLKQGKTYVVSVTGKAGYEKTLTAEFTVSDQKENVYKYLDTTYDEFILLTVWSENAKGALTVQTEKEGLIPDNTDPILKTVYNYKEGKYKALSVDDDKNFTQTYSSYTYRFFKSNSDVYTVKDFDVKISQGAVQYIAAVSTP